MSFRRQKFNAKPRYCHEGHKHASTKEAVRCDELHILQACGQITNLKVEPQFWFSINGVQIKHPNGRRVGYKPDFQYFEGDKNVVEDVKSLPTRTEAYVLRIAFFRALYPFITLREA